MGKTFRKNKTVKEEITESNKQKTKTREKRKKAKRLHINEIADND